MASQDLLLLTIEPFSTMGLHTHTVVFLPRRGDRARSFSESRVYWRNSDSYILSEAFPTFRCVFPQAPMWKCASSPETWPQWFDVWNVRDFTERKELQTVGLKEMVPEIRKLLANEAATLGGRWGRVILAGISMGAATSVHMLLNFYIPIKDGERLAAFLGFSGRCPFAGRSLPEIRQGLALEDVPDHNHVLCNTPMILQHCVDDSLVLIENGRGLRDTLRGFGAQVD